MDYKVRDEGCPFCGGTEFVKGKQEGYANLTSLESVWLSQTMYHVICRRCGSIVRSYVKNPEKLLKRKNRRKDI